MLIKYNYIRITLFAAFPVIGLSAAASPLWAQFEPCEDTEDYADPLRDWGDQRDPYVYISAWCVHKLCLFRVEINAMKNYSIGWQAL